MTVPRQEVMIKRSHVLTKNATGRCTFDAPANRAVLFHFKAESTKGKR